MTQASLGLVRRPAGVSPVDVAGVANQDLAEVVAVRASGFADYKGSLAAVLQVLQGRRWH